MTKNTANNPVLQRLGILNKIWGQFISLEHARVCRWIIAKDEVKMIDGFLEYNNSKESDFDDLFLLFYTPCQNSEAYSTLLLTELHKQISNDKPFLEKEGIQVDWSQEKMLTQPAITTQVALKQVSLFASKLPIKGFLVLVLNPMPGTSAFEKWIEEAVEIGIPQNLRLLAIEALDNEKLKTVSVKYPKQIISTRTDLDMPGAIRQLASQGDPTDPGVKFRKAYVELLNLVEKQNFKAFEQLEKIPLQIAREHNWISLEVAIIFLKGSLYLGLKKFEEAIQTYHHSYTIANNAWKSGNESAGKLAIQSLMVKGSAQIASSRYKEGADNYQLAADHAEALKDDYQLMEAYRLKGFCLENTTAKEEAYKANIKALETGSKLDAQMRESSTLPYVGVALLQLARRLNKKNEYPQIEAQLKKLLGEDWESKVVKTNKSVAV